MQNKKYIILFSLISVPYIYSCNTQNTNIPPISSATPTQIQTVFTTTKPILIPSSSLSNTPVSIPVNSENKIIKEIVGKTPEKQFDNLFQFSLDRLSMSVNNKNIYLSNYGSLFELSLDNIYDKPEHYYCGVDWDSGKAFYDGKYSNTEVLVDSKIKALSEHCSTNNIDIITGKNGKIYIFSGYKISEINNNSIKDIYKFSNMKNLSYIRIKSAVDKNSNIYITTDREIKKLSSSGIEIWSRDLLNNTDEKYLYITSIDVDSNQNVYFFDAKNLKIKVIDDKGIIKTLVGGGQNSNININAKDYRLTGDEKIITDNFDNLYILETNKNRILKYNPVTSKLELFSGNNYPSINNDDKMASDIYLNRPVSLTFDEDNNAYIVDAFNKAIRKVDAKTNISNIILGNSLTHGDGKDITKVFFENLLSFYLKNKNIYITENDRIRKIDKTNTTTTLGGNTQVFPTHSPPPNMPIFPTPTPIVYDHDVSLEQNSVSSARILYIDSNNKIYISENGTVRIINPDKKIIAPFPVKTQGVNSLTQDSKGNIYFSDDKITKLDKNNIKTIFAGMKSRYQQDEITGQIPFPPSPGDKESKRDEIKAGDKANEIYGLNSKSIVIDSKDNIYAIVTNKFNFFAKAPAGSSSAYNSEEELAIIKINPEGIVDKIYSNIGKPKNLVIDNNDNLFFIDEVQVTNNFLTYNIIKKVDNLGKISIYAGKTSNVSNLDIKNQSLIDKKASDIIFTDKYMLTNLVIDEDNNIYFSTAENKIYKIE